MAYRIGIDAGSKTIKVVVIDENDTVERSSYRRHRADILTTLTEVVHDLVWRYGDIAGTVAITGSAGIELSERLGIPFVQEVVATTRAVKGTFEQADAIIELGGEDAKVVYLSGGLEQRMNATCAGGTGGFIDTIAFMLGASSREMSSLAMGATKTYPIASRCAVFAQTDVRPLLNAGAKKTDIAASALDAVVRQTLGGLACGRPISGTVVFLGGPLEHIPNLVQRFRKALGLDHRTGIKPTDAHLFTAKGAALLSDDPIRLDAPVVETSLSSLEAALGSKGAAHDDLPRLEALFSDESEYDAFKARHDEERVERCRLADIEGSVYLGIDAGSTAVKLVVLEESGRLAYSDYRPVAGNVIATSQAMLLDLYRAFPREYDGTPLVRIEHATVTGYGESLLMTAFGIDSGVVETTAHLRAARAFEPNASFVLDIGGQDMKALWIEGGAVAKAVLNEACSSGCGSFIEGSAHSLRCTPYTFSDIAVHAASPVDLGSKCTVFMTSRVRHAQKIGVPYGDISAGIAYSVVNNALFKVIGLDSLDSLGDRIVVQGGSFLSDAVLRAFELVANKHVLRPDIAHLMGAYGAALIAHSRSGRRPSTLLGREEVAALKPRFRSGTCPGCENACTLSVVSFEDENGRMPKTSGTAHGGAPAGGTARSFIDGNRCERAYVYFENAQGRARARRGGRKAPNTVALEQNLLTRYADVDARLSSTRGNVVVGLPSVLNDLETIPFWHTLVTRLGFSVVMGLKTELDTDGIDTVASESVCYPAKITHQRIAALAKQGATAVLMPVYQQGSRCPVSSLYARAVNDSMPPFRDGRATLAAPTLTSFKPDLIAKSEHDRLSLLASLNTLAPKELPIGESEFAQALRDAKAEQAAFVETMERACDKALSWIEAEGKHGIVLAGRPYHVDPALSHGIDAMIADLGFAVLSPAGLGNRTKTAYGKAALPHRGSENESENGDASPAAWRQGKRLSRLAAFTAAHDAVDMVCLESFGCAYDAVSLLETKRALETAGRLFTTLKIDEIADTAHILIRLRTLADTIEERASNRPRNDAPPMTDASSEILAASDGPGADCPAAQYLAQPRAARLSARLGCIEQEDVELARREVSQDVCSTVAAVAGRIIRLCRANPSIDTVIVPQGCTACLFDALPELVRAPLGRVPDIVLERLWPQDEPGNPADVSIDAFARTPETPMVSSNAVPADGAIDIDTAPADDASAVMQQAPTRSSRPRIGITGNPYLVFHESLNDGVAAFLETLGGEAVLPDAPCLLVDDVRYLDQLALWEREGIDHVVYVQSFGCLKGHIESRGALHGLKERFPTLPITVIDYDPDASALNRKNRILLVVEAAKNAHAPGE